MIVFYTGAGFLLSATGSRYSQLHVHRKSSPLALFHCISCSECCLIQSDERLCHATYERAAVWPADLYLGWAVASWAEFDHPVGTFGSRWHPVLSYVTAFRWRKVKACSQLMVTCFTCRSPS